LLSFTQSPVSSATLLSRVALSSCSAMVIYRRLSTVCAPCSVQSSIRRGLWRKSPRLSSSLPSRCVRWPAVTRTLTVVRATDLKRMLDVLLEGKIRVGRPPQEQEPIDARGVNDVRMQSLILLLKPSESQVERLASSCTTPTTSIYCAIGMPQ
jgi:hypothetical protein